MRRPPRRPAWRADAVGDERTAVTVTVRLTREEHDTLERVCRAYGLNVQHLLARAVRRGVDDMVADARATGLDV